jgi:NAD(P)H-flavin reductase
VNVACSPVFEVPQPAVILGRVQESPSIFTLQLRLEDEAARAAFRHSLGQFNMLYLPGVGEVPISIMSDPDERRHIGHTIRAVGRVTHGLADLLPGARIGLRGPFGNGWPMEAMKGRDVVVVTGGLGCAPVVAAIHYILRRRADYGHLTIIQGVKRAEDLIWRDQYARWSAQPRTLVMVAADEGGPLWPWHVGRVTDLFDRIPMQPHNTMAVMCGPEGMMLVAAEMLIARGLPESGVFLSMERNMHCAVGHCGHCQFGGAFVCRDGPVFSWPQVKALIRHRGF